MKFVKEIKNHWILLVILFVGSALRLIRLETLPFGFFCDEANIGITAQSLLETGKDEYANLLPFFFQGFGDWRLPIPIYFQLPSIWLFGLSIFSVRLTTALVNIFCIFVIYNIGYIWKDKTLGLLFALLWAVSPWTIHLSRNAMEWSYPLPFFLISIYAFSKTVLNTKYFLLGAVMIGLASYTYYPAIVLAPLFFSLFVIYFLISLTKRTMIVVGLFLYLVVLIPMGIGIYENKVFSRFNTIINNNQTPRSTKEMITDYGLVYILHFDPNFLFFPIKKYEFISRHAIDSVGQLFHFGIIAIPIGMVYVVFLLQSKTKHTVVLSIFWLLLLFPLAGIANEVKYPIATRAILGSIPLTFLCGFGVYALYEKCSIHKTARWFFVGLFVLLMTTETTYFVHKYFREYPLYASDYWGWQYGTQPIISYFTKKQALYDEMYMSGEFNAPIHFANFFDQQKQCNNKCLVGDIDKKDVLKKQLFAIPAHQLKDIDPETVRVLDTIWYPNATPAFYFIEFLF